MSDDLLERATKALRAEGGAEPSRDRSELVRARVLAQTKRRAQLRPQGLWQWAAVVCLGFFVSTAMAHVIRVQLPRVIESLRAAPSAPPPAATKRARPVQPTAAAPVAPEIRAGAEPEAPAVVEQAAEPALDVAPTVPVPPAPAPARPRASKIIRPRAALQDPAVPAAPVVVHESAQPALPPPAAPEIEPATAAPPPTAKAPAAESAELTLFRRAQALHLTHDPSAIQAWDAFLRVAGKSALAPEARYNRALALVRAGRFAEAKSALAPFAEGKYGAYRRQEAQSLLVRLAK